jgi:glycosyltransferase involved in cell wall biosynthesis
MTASCAQGHSLPLISVVVPSYNQGKFLAENLESIFRQDYPRLEVVVMDGGSADGSREIIRAYQDRLAYWQSRPDFGQSAAVNAGVARCTGDLVAWLNSDDYYIGDALWTVASAYAAFPGRALYIGNGFRLHQADGRLTPFCRRHLALDRAALVQGLDYLLQPCVFFDRARWNEVGGLDPSLRFCLDWDLLIRLTAHWPAVLINDFLAVSREYESTKTASGKIGRSVEILEMITRHSCPEITPGGLYYFAESLLGLPDALSAETRLQIDAVMASLRRTFAQRFGSEDAFPVYGDPRDDIFLPISTPSPIARPHDEDHSKLPTISVIVPSFNQVAYLQRALDSLLSQHYPKLELIVMDGGSTDSSVEILRNYAPQLAYWESKRDRGPGHALNKGFAKATGEVIGWLNSDDMLACEALWRVAREFKSDPELDMVYGNAIYIDENDRLALADHGAYKTGLYFGEIQPVQRIPAYWSYVHSVPQPTVYFRRKLLDACGWVDESYHFIFDFELFFRFFWKAKVKKIEHTQAFYRLHLSAKTSSWNRFLEELYRFSRPWWPKVRDPQFRYTLKDFLRAYLRNRFPPGARGLRYWTTLGLVAASAITRIGNPETFRWPRSPGTGRQAAGELPTSARSVGELKPASPTSYAVTRSHVRYRLLFASFLWPRHPGYSGGEIRDFHLVRHLLSVSDIEFFYTHDSGNGARADHISPYLKALRGPAEFSCPVTRSRVQQWRGALVDYCFRYEIPLLGPRYHRDAAVHLRHMSPKLISGLQQAIGSDPPPHFFFVSPQLNPIALRISNRGAPTRFVMASYDVEAVRVQRLAAARTGLQRACLYLEAMRAAAFERDNLSCYDGIIAVSELDKQIFVRDYSFEPERVLVVENGIDPHYFAFSERVPDVRPVVIFVASLGYLPNHLAAMRLVQRVMPYVWRARPDAEVCIVGQDPQPELLALAGHQRVLVTGRVDDVRPYLARAAVACVPLTAGSGTKYKILEALSAGVPVVCTALATEGLNVEPGEHVLIAKTDEALATSVLTLINDPALARMLAHRARAHVEAVYSWDANLHALDEWLPHLLALPKRASTEKMA